MNYINIEMNRIYWCYSRTHMGVRRGSKRAFAPPWKLWL